jgi:uncharacterized protein
MGQRRHITVWHVLLGVLLIGLMLALDAFWWEPSSLAVVRHKIRLKRGAPLGGLRIAVIADLHAGAPYIDEAKIAEIVRRTNAERPDLILLNGDFVGCRMPGQRPIAIETVAALLRPLQARLGVYAFIGNHDHHNGAARVIAALEGAGFPVLENRATTVSDGSFVIAGFGHAYSNPGRAEDVLAGLAPDATILCVTHSPDMFPRLPERCILTIAGHTHGGQVSLPLLGRMMVPSCFGQRYAAGLTVESGRTLFVSTGIGTSVLPVRFGVRPEISILEISVHG